MRMKNIFCETLHVSKTLHLLVNFSINTTYKQPIKLIFRFCHKISENLEVMGKNGFRIRIQQEESQLYIEIVFMRFFFFCRPVLLEQMPLLWQVSTACSPYNTHYCSPSIMSLCMETKALHTTFVGYACGFYARFCFHTSWCIYV